jgi:large subunit ribosomal protein L23
MALLDRLKKKIKKEEPAKGGPVSGGKEKKEKVEKSARGRPAFDEKEKPRLKEESLVSPKEAEKAKPEKIIAKQAPQAYRLIKEPQITEKATFLSDQNKYVFKVSSRANKTEIRKTIEALYGVKVVKVHLTHAAAKRRRLGRSQGWRGGLKKGFKKAVVTLAQGEKIELLPR